MKAVMMSIQPKWCELIASGKKTIEVRKTRPKLETPFKCYIYQTKKAWLYDIYSVIAAWQRKVIGEFVCDNIWEIFVVCDVHDELPSRPCEYWLEWESDIDDVPKEACLSAKEIMSYLGKQYNGFAWHISDLVIYDKPKEFYNFCRPCDKNCDKCNYLEVQEIGNFEHTKVFKTCLNRITRPPQSWCYVEELR